MTLPACRCCGIPYTPDSSYPNCWRCGAFPPKWKDARAPALKAFHEMPARKSTRVSSNDQRWLDED